jgi:radical SAM protein with 4Fe4S-binding SPASM domain
VTSETAAPALPGHLQVEVTGACNLRCRMCLVRYRPPLARADASMTLADITRLLDELPDLERLTLQGLGEPLLVRDLVDMVRVAAARGVEVGFNTNGTLLTEAKGRALIEAGLSWLCVSIDGATAETFESIRDGANFQRVVANTRAFAEQRRRLGATQLDLAITFVAMRSNVAELPDLVALAAELGVPRVRVQNLSHDFDDCDPAGSYAEIREFARHEALWHDDDTATAQRIFAKADDLATALGVDLRLPEVTAVEAPAVPVAVTPRDARCSWPWDGAYVTHDGTVQPCCMVMGSDRVGLGNVSTESFPVVWRARDYERFRDGLMSGPAHEVCQGCSVYRGVF